MVLLGLGILVASLTYLVYRVPPSAWRTLNWRRAELTRVGSQNRSDERKDKRISQQDAEDVKQDESSNSIITAGVSRGGENDARSGQTSLRAKAEDISGEVQSPRLVLNVERHNVTESGGLPDDFQRSPKTQRQTAQGPRSPVKSTPQQDRSTMPPPSLPTSKAPREQRRPSTLLMPPSSRPQTNALRPLPKLGNTLNPPPSAASTLRGPPSRNLTTQKVPVPASTSTLSPSSRPSKKVLLTPGHSPLDWAHLIAHPPTPTFLRGVSLPPQLIRVPPSLLRYHNGRKGRDAWSTWQGKVYNLTPYLKFHPGGEDQLMRGAGKVGEAERLFLEVHPWVNWEGMLGECLVGIMVGEEEAGGGELEEMD